ncbi:unnamed protein product [Ranitomeya imitator]|uniref:SEA domain-containing protein n=1 Tax=Ranitomeya imitator TaxID=111125 RepID=A0ABN9MDF4_9NEOB|nr:unnamed protein product [Ranitomeya imitator]
MGILRRSIVLILTSLLVIGAVTPHCQNGGHHDGNKCICGTSFYGTRCEFILSEIRPVVNATVNVTVTVVETFKDELRDPNSKEYTDFVIRFNQQMARLYSEIPHYKGIFRGVEIINITEGSIIVEHILLLKIYADEYDEIVDEVFTLLNHTNCTSDTKTERLCFKANTTKVQPVPLDFKEICLKSLDIPKDIQEYYSPVNVSGKTMCVSRCSVNSEDPINCNKGQCSVTRQGPNCYCETSPDYWYSGDRCQTAISKPGVYAGVSVGLFVLLVIIIALAVFLYRRRRPSNKERLIDENRWYEEGWEEENRGPAASFSNSSASDSAVPVNSIFLPDLEKVNTSMKVTVPRANVVLSGNPYERTT